MMLGGGAGRQHSVRVLLGVVALLCVAVLFFENKVIRKSLDLTLLSMRNTNASQCSPCDPFPVDVSERTIFVVTPTYARRTQLLDLTRVRQALHLAALKHRIVWIIVEDAHDKTDLVHRFVAETQVPTVHLNIYEEKKQNTFKANLLRNLGIRYIRSLENVNPNSIIYFADDDNAYDERLFDEFTKIKSIGVFPVSFSGARRVETPIVKDGKVVDFASWRGGRKLFPMDMAGFALAVRHFLTDDHLEFLVHAPSGTGEDRLLLDAGFKLEDLEPLADDCTKVYAWHVKTLIRVDAQFDEDSAHIVDV